MAKHKKPAPAAKKPAAKPAAKPATKKTTPVPAKKPESPKSSSEKKPVAKAPKTAPKPAVKSPAKEPVASKSRPPMPAPEKAAAKVAPEKKTSKTTPPLPSKTNPPIEPKTPSAQKVATPATKAKAAKADARELLRNRILGAKKASKPIAFTLEEAREIAKTVASTAPAQEAPKPAKASKATPAKTDLSKIEKPATPNHVKAASLADILGFNPKKTQKPTADVDPEDIPEKFRRYYKLLLELRAHITEGLNLHTEETLKRSAKDDAGDLSSYGQHMADAGTDTFDRDFALSLVSSEQEALTEIESAIKRIKDGTYGTCEVTGKPIAKERLTAVPFTRYSAEAQKEIEKNRMRTRTAAGLFGEMGEEGARIADDDGGGDE